MISLAESDERLTRGSNAHSDTPEVKFVGAYAVADGGTLSAAIDVSGERTVFCLTDARPRLPWGSNRIYVRAGHPTDKKARLVRQDSPEEEQLIRNLEFAMAPHLTMAATQARKQAIARGGKDGIPLPPGGDGPYGVEIAITMLNRLHAIVKQREKAEADRPNASKP